MMIDEKTAQLILDAIAWCNDEWVKNLDDKPWSDALKIVVARADFTRFCSERGITTIERKVTL